MRDRPHARLAYQGRLPDLKTPSAQQRNVVLHPEFTNGQYAFYTRPQDAFIEAGRGGGIALGLASRIDHMQISDETVIDPKNHTVYSPQLLDATFHFSPPAM